MTNLQLKEILKKMNQSDFLGGHEDGHLDCHMDSGIKIKKL